MIYHITYLSHGYQVKGYLSLPHGYSFPAEILQSWIEQHYAYELKQQKVSDSLPVTLLAEPCQPYVRHEALLDQQHPAFIYCRGGIGRVGSVKTSWLEQFAQHEHVVFAPCYRGNEGGDGYDEFGGAEQEDVRQAIKLLGSLPFIDSDRLSIMGFSRGAINATQAAAELPLHRLVLWSGVSDLARTYEERVDLRRMLKRVIHGSPVKQPDAYRARSPYTYATRINCPVLVIHGTQDEQVDYQHGQLSYNQLTQSGKLVCFHTYEGYGHHFPTTIHQLAIARMFEWIRSPAAEQHIYVQ